MKVGYFAESPADQAAVTILTEAILGRKTEPVPHAGLRHRGWPAVLKALPGVLKELHYHTDAEGLVYVVDANGSTPHQVEHERTGAADEGCRLCLVRRVADDALRQTRPRAGRAPLKLALGLAVPAIEAWLLCGLDARVSEAAWINGLKSGRRPYTKEELKRTTHGSDRAPTSILIESMTQHATRLSSDIAALERHFPAGFGALAKRLREW